MIGLIDSNSTYSLSETASILGVHPRTITRKIKTKDFQAKRIGKHWVILGQNIIDFLNGDGSTEAAMLANELGLLNDKLKTENDLHEALAGIIKNAPDRPSIYYQISNILKQIRES